MEMFYTSESILDHIRFILKKTKIEVGAQNCHHSYDFGAYTGQINSRMLKSVGAKYVIITFFLIFNNVASQRLSGYVS